MLLGLRISLILKPKLYPITTGEVVKELIVEMIVFGPVRAQLKTLMYTSDAQTGLTGSVISEGKVI